MPRALPDRDAVVLGALRAGLTGVADVARHRLDGWLERLDTRPLVVARVVTGDATQMLAHRQFAEVDVQSWAKTPQAASDTDDAALTALRRARSRGAVYAGGRIAYIDIQALGAEVPDPGQAGREDLYRWQAGYRLTIRPA